jgi:hypothetical protein
MTTPAPSPTTDPVTGAGNSGDSDAPSSNDQASAKDQQPSGTPAPAPSSGPTQSSSTSSDGGQQQQQKQGDDKPKDDKAKDEPDWKSRARQWEDRAKENKTAAEERDQLKLTVQAIMAAIDPKASKDDDPEAIAERAVQERDAKDNELKQLRIEHAAERAARRAGADVDALLDSRSFSKILAKLDPEADDFNDRLGDAIDEALKANPKLKAAATAAPAPTRTAADPGGTRSTTGQLTRADLATMSPEQIVEARKAGRLDALLKGAAR